jgi:Ca2+-binding EF-hand superfamily protein
MKKFPLVIASLSAVALISTPVLAKGKCKRHHGGPHGGKMLKRMDANNDGNVSLQEFKDGHTKHFKRMDRNGDAKLTQDELKRKRGKKRHGPLMNSDANNDGTITFDEFKAHHDKLFADIDANRDKSLSREEARQFGRNKRFEKFDTNKDGSISREEFFQHQDMKRGKRRNNGNHH